MLEISVQTERQERHPRVSVGELTELVRRIGGRGDRFLVLERLPGEPEVYAQVWHEAGGGYTVEHREGAADRHFQAEAADPAAVAAALAGWARQEPGWDAELAWTRLAPDDPAGAPPLELDPADRADLEQQLRRTLAGGYASRAELAELAEEYLVTADRRPVSPAQAAALADRLWQDRLAEQAGWRGETDPERLTRAFEALEQAGITAREHFTCCRGCGQAEIGDEARPGARGFVYFHAQCTEGAADGGGLTLLYGGFDGSAATTAGIGREVVAALAAVGLRCSWDEDPGRAITVTPLDWRRRIAG
ncbi:DUF6891 domain-containing protein [Kitasatospora sp. NPDC006697]|uniref:DUF6891 domain-containing protein n=1 Tax=Kitasatospora sp. NPDC006697 TaxID=3364020 RepID=UPI0036A023C1